MKPSLYTPGEPIAAAATPLMPSALGIVRTSGTGVLELLSKLFSRPKALSNASGNSLVYGWIVDPAAANRRVDEVMVAVCKAPRSYTGEDTADIICHGGPVPITAVLNLLLSNGFRLAEPGEFSFRGFVNGKADLTKTEAVREIIDSRTDDSRERAAGRLAGSLQDEIISLKNRVMNVLASIEVEIEYPEEEISADTVFDPSETAAVGTDLARLEATWAAERLYQEGARVVLCGRTNAGKSSLFNTLLKEERAIVSEIHGTTRDWLESWASFEGIPVRLYDTAGLRETEDVVEQAGVRRTLGLTEEADLILYVVDSSQGMTAEDTEFIRKHENIPLVLVWNKADKAGEGVSDAGARCPQVRTSARSGMGMNDLVHTAKRLLMAKTAHTSDGAALGSQRQKEAVRTAREALDHAVKAANDRYPLDAIAQDIEEALTALGEITGEITSADILDTVFSNFCVGK